MATKLFSWKFSMNLDEELFGTVFDSIWPFRILD